MEVANQFRLHRCLFSWIQCHSNSPGKAVKLCGHDEFVTGVLSKLKGLILRIAAVYNALFTVDENCELTDTISDIAVKAGVDFACLCGDNVNKMARSLMFTS